MLVLRSVADFLGCFFSKPSFKEQSQMSNEKNPGCLRYIGDYTTQLYRDYNNPLCIMIPIN